MFSTWANVLFDGRQPPPPNLNLHNFIAWQYLLYPIVQQMIISFALSFGFIMFLHTLLWVQSWLCLRRISMLPHISPCICSCLWWLLFLRINVRRRKCTAGCRFRVVVPLILMLPYIHCYICWLSLTSIFDYLSFVQNIVLLCSPTALFLLISVTKYGVSKVYQVEHQRYMWQR